uniref:Putative secreted protein n=1 Tax=Xenopsylla cheopis TaxID=163159 RepID=A0A6M2DUK1_XENCH
MERTHKITMPICIFALTLMVACMQMAEAKPTWRSPYQNSIDRSLGMCDSDEEVMELCQRCAKVTKSNTVFPMCCDNHDEALTWCNQYVNFGKP